MNSNPLFLAIETCSEICSIALFRGNELVVNKHVLKENSHSALLTPMIEEAFADAGLSMGKLDALVVGSGPGSYTGLRVGVSTAKGIAYALDLPICLADTLQAMAYGLKQLVEPNDKQLFFPMLDARRMEVYTACYDQELKRIQEPKPIILENEEDLDYLNHPKNELIIGGNGSMKIQELPFSNIQIIKDPIINALNYGELGLKMINQQAFADVAYCEPFYLKSPPLKKPKKLI